MVQQTSTLQPLADVSQRNYSPWRAHGELEQVDTEKLKLMEKPKAGAEKCEEEKGAVDRNCYRLTADLHSLSPCAAQWGEGRRVGSEGLKLSLGEKG